MPYNAQEQFGGVNRNSWIDRERRGQDVQSELFERLGTIKRRVRVRLLVRERDLTRKCI